MDSAWVTAAVQCARRFRAQGVDLGAYTTRAIADDIEDLRKVLAIERWNLYGASYSTRIMLTVMRERPGTVRSAVLDSPLPPESRFDEVAASSVLRSWQVAFNTCAVVAACAATHPRLPEQFAVAVQRFTEHPRWVKLGDAAAADSVFLTGELLGYELGSVMNGPGSAQASALIVERAAAGDVDLLVPLLREDAAPSSFTWGMRMLIWCADFVPFEDRARIAAQRAPSMGLGGANLGVVPAVACDAAGIPHSPSIEGVAVHSDIPTLVVSGGFDPNTPTPWARGLLLNMPNAFLVEFPGLAHVPGFRPCGTLLIDKFFRDPLQPPIDACVAHGPGLIIR
jgi:pimeloyl-ACP methyl ester carboxylesterase